MKTCFLRMGGHFGYLTIQNVLVSYIVWKREWGEEKKKHGKPSPRWMIIEIAANMSRLPSLTVGSHFTWCYASAAGKTVDVQLNNYPVYKYRTLLLLYEGLLQWVITSKQIRSYTCSCLKSCHFHFSTILLLIGSILLVKFHSSLTNFQDLWRGKFLLLFINILYIKVNS